MALWGGGGQLCPGLHLTDGIRRVGSLEEKGGVGKALQAGEWQEQRQAGRQAGRSGSSSRAHARNGKTLGVEDSGGGDGSGSRHCASPLHWHSHTYFFREVFFKQIFIYLLFLATLGLHCYMQAFSS